MHLAGIVPVISQTRDFKMPWDDCLMPIAPGYLAYERAVLECAYAGCDTIWIICNDDVSPIVRKRIGDFVEDPVYLGRKTRFPDKERKPVSVYYLPLNIQDFYKQNCQAWAITYGALTIKDISARISKWVMSEKYYVAFPHSVYDPAIVREDRRLITTKDNYFLQNGKTFADGEKMGFSFGNEDLEKFERYFIDLENNELFSRNTEYCREYYDNRVLLDNLSDLVILKETDKVRPVPWSHQIDTWDQYCAFLKDPVSKTLAHPGELVMSYREQRGIGGI